MRLNNNGASLLGVMVVLIIIAVGMLGVIMVVSSMQDYYSPITNGTVDPGGIAESGVLNMTTNLTTTMVDVGSGIFWIFFIVFFIVLFGLVYAYVKR